MDYLMALSYIVLTILLCTIYILCIVEDVLLLVV